MNNINKMGGVTMLKKGLLLILSLTLIVPLSACNTFSSSRASAHRERPARQVQRPQPESNVQITPYSNSGSSSPNTSSRPSRRDQSARNQSRRDQTAKPRVRATIQPSGTAVVALLGNANQQSSSGRLDSAAASLERALRIEPRNPEIWYRLAAVRFQQHQYDQASSLAAKSINLAGDNQGLIERNRKIIAAAARH